MWVSWGGFLQQITKAKNTHSRALKDLFQFGDQLASKNKGKRLPLRNISLALGTGLLKVWTKISFSHTEFLPKGYVRAFCTMGILSMSQIRFQKSSSFRISFFCNFVVDHYELTPKISKQKGFVWYAILLNLYIFQNSKIKDIYK